MRSDLLNSTASIPEPNGKKPAKRKPYGDAQPAYHALADQPPSAVTVVAPPPPATMHHQRHGDRGSKDDADAGRRLPTFVRYNDLVAAGIVGNWPSLLRLIDKESFPIGLMLGRNTRAWQLDEIESWLATRPTAKKAIVLPKTPRGRKIKDIAELVNA